MSFDKGAVWDIDGWFAAGKAEAWDIDDWFAARLAKVRWRRYFVKLAAATLAAAVTVWVLFGVVFEVSTVRGTSMSPNLQDGDAVLSLRLSSEYSYGDVVIIEGGSSDYIKRIIGTPGDTIAIDVETGTVFRNGMALEEPYASGVTLLREEEVYFTVTLGVGEYFLLGDNRTYSYDSRDWGVIEKERIKAKVILPKI